MKKTKKDYENTYNFDYIYNLWEVVHRHDHLSELLVLQPVVYVLL